LKEIFPLPRQGGTDSVRLIIEDSDPAERGRIRKALQEPALLAKDERIVLRDELPIIDAFAVEAPIAAARELQKMAARCPHMKVFRDEPMGIPEGDWSDQGGMEVMMDVAARTLGVDKVWGHGDHREGRHGGSSRYGRGSPPRPAEQDRGLP